MTISYSKKNKYSIINKKNNKIFCNILMINVSENLNPSKMKLKNKKDKIAEINKNMFSEKKDKKYIFFNILRLFYFFYHY